MTKVKTETVRKSSLKLQKFLDLTQCNLLFVKYTFKLFFFLSNLYV